MTEKRAFDVESPAAWTSVCKNYAVHPCTTQNDLKEVWKIDTTEYGDMNVDFSLLHNWWEKFPYGHYVIKKGDEVIGGLGIWPLSKSSYQGLLKGKIIESEMSICKPRRGAETVYWYISGMILKTNYRRKRAVWCLIRQVMVHWYTTQAVAHKTIVLGTIPISKEGLDMVTRFAFHPTFSAEQRKDHYPFYEKKITHDAVDLFYKEFKM